MRIRKILTDFRDTHKRSSLAEAEGRIISLVNEAVSKKQKVPTVKKLIEVMNTAKFSITCVKVEDGVHIMETTRLVKDIDGIVKAMAKAVREYLREYLKDGK